MATESRARRKEIAESTLRAMENGSYILNNKTHTLSHSAKDTQFYKSSDLSNWLSTSKPSQTQTKKSQISIVEISTIEAAQLLSRASSKATAVRGADEAHVSISNGRIGILNFASAKKPGGGFLGGAQAQEESIARSSTLFQSLTSRAATEFYSSHKKDSRGGYYSHAMIFSPTVTVFRNDSGGWIEPFTVSVVTSPAVNAGVVRKHSTGAFVLQEEERIERVMKERMARILFLFESMGISHLILGSFGTGVFQNTVSVVARLWAELLGVPGSRFISSFETVVFGIIGKTTYEEFKEVFEATCRNQPNSSI